MLQFSSAICKIATSWLTVATQLPLHMRRVALKRSYACGKIIQCLRTYQRV